MFPQIAASPAQLRYANTLFYGSLLGFIALLASYFAYVTGLLSPQVPLEEMVVLLQGSAADYRATAHIPQGWGWITLVGKGDIINFLGIVFLAGLTIICYLQLAFSFMRSKDWLMSGIAVLEVLTLSLAASGLLVVGAH